MRNQTAENRQRQAVIPLLLDGSLYQEYSSRPQQLLRCGKHRQQRALRLPLAASCGERDVAFVNTACAKAMRYRRSDGQQYQDKIYMASGRVLCFIGNTANTGIDPREWISSGPSLLLLDAAVLARYHMENGGSTPWCPKAADAPKGCLWLDYMSSDDGMMMNIMAFEGWNYHWNANGTIRLTEACAKTGNFAYGYSAWWTLATSPGNAASCSTWGRFCRLSQRFDGMCACSYQIPTC